jgi:hypothetical protein
LPKLATTATVRRQLRATPWLTIAALLSSCGRTPPDERVVWSTGAPGKAVRGDYSAGDVAIAGSDTWILYVDGIRKFAIDPHCRRPVGAQKSTDDRVPATLDGAKPRLLFAMMARWCSPRASD